MLMVTTKDFENEVLKNPLPVVVDFWAAWCGPCRVFAPIFEETAKELEGKVKFAKVNVDEEGALSEKYGAMSIPTIMLLGTGKQWRPPWARCQWKRSSSGLRII